MCSRDRVFVPNASVSTAEAHLVGQLLLEKQTLNTQKEIEDQRNPEQKSRMHQAVASFLRGVEF
jgi:hypothetical protein